MSLTLPVAVHVSLSRPSWSNKLHRRLLEPNIALDSCEDCRQGRVLSCKKLPSCCRPKQRCVRELLREAFERTKI